MPNSKPARLLTPSHEHTKGFLVKCTEYWKQIYYRPSNILFKLIVWALNKLILPRHFNRWNVQLFQTCIRPFIYSLTTLTHSFFIHSSTLHSLLVCADKDCVWFECLLVCADQDCVWFDCVFCCVQKIWFVSRWLCVSIMRVLTCVRKRGFVFSWLYVNMLCVQRRMFVIRWLLFCVNVCAAENVCFQMIIILC